MSTIAYCRARGIEPLTDSTNASEQFLRNRLRTGVLPALLRENPRLVEDVTAAMTLLRDQQAFVRAEVDRRWDEIAGPAGSLRRDVLVAWPMALASEAIRLAAERIVGPPSPLEHRHVSQLLAAAGACGPRRLHLPGGLEAVVDDGHLRIQRRRPASTPPAPVVLAVPGTVRFGPWTLRAERRTARDVRRSSGPRHVWVRSGGPFLVRSRRPGDRYRPFGGPGSVMLQDALVNWKTPREERDFVPVVVEGEAIVWLVGGRVAGDQAVAEGDEATWIEAHRDA
ncbi:MAG: hypothetical protein KatS3mg060_0863 [Dehalococcoidia bacterium]|nr:MAG: hypothetical protein KatS3mg060_0863 [Dehalococcoidia bacterium]